MLPPLSLSMQSAKNVCVSLNRSNISQSCAFMFTVHKKSQQKCKRWNKDEPWKGVLVAEYWAELLIEVTVQISCWKVGPRTTKGRKRSPKSPQKQPLRRVKMQRKFQWIQKEKKRTAGRLMHILGLPSKNNHKVDRNTTLLCAKSTKQFLVTEGWCLLKTRHKMTTDRCKMPKKTLFCKTQAFKWWTAQL